MKETEGHSPHPVDIYVGKRLRLRRNLLGLSQEKLGEQIGLTFQQVQKYERAANRIGASRLWEISQVLDVPVTFFYEGYQQEAEGYPEAGAGFTDKNGVALSELANGTQYEADPLKSQETLELIRNYYRISDPIVRDSIARLIKDICTTGSRRVSGETKKVEA